MAYVEHIRLPVTLHAKLSAGGRMSEIITKIVKEYVDGELVLDATAKEKMVQTTIVTDNVVMEKAREIAKEKGLTFNKAIVMMLDQALQ